MKKEVLLMYSGGLDSILSCIRLVSKGYKVYLIHFDNGSSIGTENIQIGAQRLITRFKDQVEFLGIASIAGYFIYYRGTTDIENLNAEKLYKNIRYLQERDIDEKRVVLQKLPKDKITWY